MLLPTPEAPCNSFTKKYVRKDYVLQISKSAPLKRKEVDDVLGGQDAWKNVQKTDSKPWLHLLLQAFASISSKLAYRDLVMQLPAQAAATLRHTSRRSRHALRTSLQPCFSSVCSASTSGKKADRSTNRWWGDSLLAWPNPCRKRSKLFVQDTACTPSVPVQKKISTAGSNTLNFAQILPQSSASRRS